MVTTRAMPASGTCAGSGTRKLVEGRNLFEQELVNQDFGFFGNELLLTDSEQIACGCYGNGDFAYHYESCRF